MNVLKEFIYADCENKCCVKTMEIEKPIIVRSGESRTPVKIPYELAATDSYQDSPRLQTPGNGRLLHCSVWRVDDRDCKLQVTVVCFTALYGAWTTETANSR